MRRVVGSQIKGGARADPKDSEGGLKCLNGHRSRAGRSLCLLVSRSSLKWRAEDSPTFRQLHGHRHVEASFGLKCRLVNVGQGGVPASLYHCNVGILMCVGCVGYARADVSMYASDVENGYAMVHAVRYDKACATVSNVANVTMFTGIALNRHFIKTRPI